MAETVVRHDLVEIFEATAKLDHAKSAKELIRQLGERVKAHGYTACLVTDLPNQRTGNLDEHILINGWSAEWHNHYMTAGHYRHDPCAALCRIGIEPFIWSDLRRRLTDEHTLRVMNEAEEFGLRDGLCIPIHLPNGETGAVTLAGVEIDLSPPARRAVHALSRHAYAAAQRLSGRDDVTTPQRLSEREREILQWTSAGKTAWEVSRILGISESTVHTHLRNAKQKLNTGNIVQAIMEAVRRHEIEL